VFHDTRIASTLPVVRGGSSPHSVSRNGSLFLPTKLLASTVALPAHGDRAVFRSAVLDSCGLESQDRFRSVRREASGPFAA